MKKLSFAVSLAAALVAVALAAPASAKPLEPLTQEAIDAPAQTSIIVITGDDCASCADTIKALEAQADKHPEVKFLKGSAADFGVDKSQLPLVGMLVPEIGIAYSKVNFVPGNDVDKFITERLAAAAKDTAAVAAVHKAQADLDAATKPFMDELTTIKSNAQTALAPLKAQFDTIAAPFNAQMADIKTRFDAAVGDLPSKIQNAATDEEYDAAVKKFQELGAPFAKELQDVKAKLVEATKDIRAQAAAAAAPFDAQIKELQTRAAAALAPLNAKVQEAQAAVMTTVQADMATSLQ